MMETITLKVSGMQCSGCASTIKEKLEGCAGISNARADHKAGTVAVEFDPATIDLDQIKKTITESGYTPE